MLSKFPLFKKFESQLTAGYTSKVDGSFKEEDSNFEKNVEKLRVGELETLHQTHSDLIVKVSEIPTRVCDGDALITNRKNVALAVKMADCQGVVIFDSKRLAVAVVHSGWKGSVQNIIGKTIRKMALAYNSASNDLMVAISPSLGPCCSEFTDPKNELPSFCEPYLLKKNHVDFWALTKKQCMNEGVLESNIENVRICTKDSPDFFSHRAKDLERMVVIAKLI